MFICIFITRIDKKFINIFNKFNDKKFLKNRYFQNYVCIGQ